MSQKSKPVLLFVFAHPDDDAFGPAGSLAKMTADYDIYFICATKGEAGQNHSSTTQRSLSTIREEEVTNSAKTIGAKDIFFLPFQDGELSNNTYHALADAIQHYVDKLVPAVLVTWEPRGITGHIDHIIVSLVCHFVFYRSPSLHKLLLYCLSEYQTDQFLENYFIYRPPGYKRHEIDMIYDISDVWEIKLKAMHCHVSQQKDMAKIMQRPKVRLMEDCYQVLTK